MAVRLDNVADYFSRTTDLLDYNAAYTWMTGVYFVTGTGGTYMTVLGHDNGASFQHSDEIGVDDAGSFRFIIIANNNFSFNAAQSSVTPVNDTWYHVAMVRRSLTALDLYINGTLEATSTGDMTGRGSATEMLVGAGYGGGNNNVNGRYGGMKAWSAALTAAEVRNEMNSLTPKRTANYYGRWPIFPGTTERLRDYGPSARNWTANGTLTDEAGPPVNWGIWTPPRSFKRAATVFTLNAAGSLAPSGALIRQANKLYSGTILPVGVLNKQANRSYSGAITPAGTLLRQANKALAGSIPLAGAIVSQANKALSGSLNPSGLIIKQVNTAYTGQITPPGGLNNQAQTSLSGSITPSGALGNLKLAVLALAGAITPTGTLIKQVNKLLSGAIGLAGNLIKQANTSYAGQLTPSGEIDNQAQTRLSGSITPSGVMGKQISKLLSGSITLAGTLSFIVNKVLSGAITPISNLIKQVNTAYSGQMTPSGGVVKSVSTFLSGAIGLAGSLSNLFIPAGSVTAPLVALFKGMYKGMFKRMK